MAISIDWSNGIIFIPKDYTTLIQLTPTEIRGLDTNQFRLDLKNLEDDVEGIPFPKTHNHNPPVSVGGIELARVVSITNDYTITFENGLWAVNLQGSNNNILDRTNKNQVSVNPSNSAGLITSSAIEYGEYGGAVTIDMQNVTGKARSGIVYPVGTLRFPSNVLVDAELIAKSKGFSGIKLISDVTLKNVDFTGYKLEGLSHVATQVIVESSAMLDYAVFTDVEITGTLDSNAEIHKCIVRDLDYFNGHIHDSAIGGTITLGGTTESYIENCSRLENETFPIIDFNNEDNHLVMPRFAGSVKLKNMTVSGLTALIGLDQGLVQLDSANCIAGSITLAGVGKLIDENGELLESGSWNGMLITNMLVSNESIARTTWNSKTSSFIESGTFGAEVIIRSSIKDLQILIEEQRESHTGTGDMYYVDPVNGDSFANGNDGSFSKPLASVQDCHDNLVTDSHHDIITLLAGNSSGITILDEKVTLSKNYTFIRGPGRDFLWKASSPGDVITVTGAGIELKSFQLSTHTTGVGDGIKVTGADFTRIENVWIGKTQGHGISINHSSTILVIKCSLQDCGVSGAGHGISIDPSGGVTQGILITDTYFSYIKGDGITVKSSNVEHVIIENNKFHHCEGWGVNINNDTLNTFVTLNVFGGNTSGNIQDNGTGTIAINNEQWGTVDKVWSYKR